MLHCLSYHAVIKSSIHFHISLHTRRWRHLQGLPSASVYLPTTTSPLSFQIATKKTYRIISSVRSGWRAAWWRRRGRSVVGWWGGRCGAWRLSLWLLLGVVLVVSYVILVATICGVGIAATVVGGVLGAVIGRAAGSRGSWGSCWSGGCGGGGLDAGVGAVGVGIGGLAIISSSSALLVAVGALLGRVFFEADVLLADVVEEGFAELFGFGDHGWVWAAEDCQLMIEWKVWVTHATWRYIGSSLSRLVPCSIKPEFRPLIWTRHLVSCWMCFT